MDVQWFKDWFYLLSIGCTYPIWFVLMMTGGWQPAGSESVRQILMRNDGSSPLLNAVCFTPFALIIYLSWPCWAVMAYYFGVTGLMDLHGGFALDITILAIMGCLVGLWAAFRYLPRLDAYFGVQHGFGAAAKCYEAVGLAYLAVKVVKGGAQAGKKL